MATTDARLAAAVLDSLAQSGLEFAVLHGEQGIARGESVSDVDVVVAMKPRLVIERASASLESAGLRPIMIWDYDVGGTATVFLTTSDASDGVQLDLMYDPHGQGTYGARCGPMLASRVNGERWPTVGEAHRIAYLIRKRHVKKDAERLRELLSEARLFPQTEFSSLVRETFASRVAVSILDLVAGGRSSHIPLPRGYRASNAARGARRLLRPTGFWVEITGESATALALGVARRFERFLPVVAMSRRPRGGLAQMSWIMSKVVPVRWRAGVFVSVGIGWPRGDLRLVVPNDLDELCSRIVEAMNSEVRD